MTEGELLTADFFNRVGEALFGDRWKAVLGRAITCNGRLIRFYSVRGRAVPVEVWRKLSATARTRAQALDRLADRIDAALPEAHADIPPLQ